MSKYFIEINRNFLTFSNKELSGMEKMFSRDVSLREWKIDVIGKKEAMKTIKVIFDIVGSIRGKWLKIYNDKYTVIA